MAHKKTKAGPGRPSLGATVPLTIHVTPAQYKKLLGAALSSGKSMASMLREILNDIQASPVVLTRKKHAAELRQ